MRKLVLVLLIGLLVSCSSTYEIKEGNHRHSNGLQRVWFAAGGQIDKEIILEDDCWYPESEVQNLGYNKLIGIGGANHHKYSARIVYLPDFNVEGKIDLYSYIYYEQDEWVAEYLTSVVTGQQFSAMVYKERNPGKYVCYVNGKYWHYDHPNPKGWKRLHWYFGGQDEAYWDMNSWQHE